MNDRPEHVGSGNGNGDIAAAKAAIREHIRQRVQTISPEQQHDKSLAACRRLVGLDAFRHASTVMLYMPLPNEVDLTPVAIHCFRSGKLIVVPQVDWERREMRPIEVTTFDDEMMHVDHRGIRSPREGRPLPLDSIDLIVVPGLAFDASGRRLGRGGGFYDRFLSRFRKLPALVGLAFDEQMTDQVPVTPLDIVLDIVVTDRRIVRETPARTH